MIQSIFCLAPIMILFLWNIRFAKKNEYYDDYMRIDNLQSIRGILAILIVIHHFSGMVSGTTAFLVFNHIGYLVVALFLFISGYGLAYGVKNKPGYVKGTKFLYTRIPKLVIPYWVAVILYTIGYYLSYEVYNDGRKITIKEVLLSFVSYDSIVGFSWYIFELIILYLIFFVVFKIRNQKKAIILLFGAVTVCAVGFYLCDDFSNVWYRSIFAFPLGVLFSLKQDKFENFYSKKSFFNYSLTIASLILLLGIRYVCVVMEFEHLQVVFDVLSSAIFSLAFVIVLRKIRMRNKVLNIIGSISYEIYLIHFLIISLMQRYYINSQINLLLYFAVSILLIVCIAWIMNNINKYLVNCYIRILNLKK